MRYPSGVTDQVIYFVAVDSTDLKTRETGLTTFTVYRTRDGGTAAAFTTPTVTEVDATNMPGLYKLLLDEDMTIAAGNDSEEVALHITHAGMDPVTRVFELYRPKATTGETLTVASGVASADAKAIDGSTTAADILQKQLDAIHTDTAQAGTGTTITLASGASTSDSFYVNGVVYIVGGTGAGTTPRYIDTYVGGTRVATVSPAWTVNPDATSVYLVIPAAPASTTLPPAVDVVKVGGTTVPSTSGRMEVNVTHVSGSAQDIATATSLTGLHTKTDTVDTVVDGVKAVTDLLPNAGALTTLINHLTDIKGATFTGGTDSLEAIRDRGDAAWTTGAGGSAPTVADIRSEIDANSTQLAAIVAAIAAVQGAGFLTGTDSLEAIRDRGDAAWLTGAGGSSPTVEQIRAEMDSNSTKFASIVASLAGVLSANITQVEGVTTVDGESLIGWMRILGAFAAGDTTGFDSDSPAFAAMDGSKTRIAGTLDANKNRTISTLVGT